IADELPRPAMGAGSDGIRDVEPVERHAGAGVGGTGAVWTGAGIVGETASAGSWLSVRPVSWSSLAASAVQPVWCEAPRPLPLSPLKYSKNSMWSRQSGSVELDSPPKTGRRPCAS